MTELPHHENSGACDRCRFIFSRYSGFHTDLYLWFESFQTDHPEGHISCAGRGQHDQEALFLRGVSKAHWKQSAHNWNCALDLFCLIPNVPNIYFNNWFEHTLSPTLPDWINWYGRKGAPYYELPHIEVKNWVELVRDKKVRLVGQEA